MNVLLAAAPILAPVVLLLALRQSALRAGAVGLLVALVLISWVPHFGLPPGVLEDTLVAGGLVTWLVAYVLLGGLVLYEVLREAGALEALADWVARLVPDPVRRALILVFGLSVFFESATGFGIGIVVAAPLFMALGYRPREAALLALAGQCGVTWGALAVGTVLGGQLTGVPAAHLGVLSAFLSLPLMLACGAAAVHWSGGKGTVLRRLPEVALYALSSTGVCAATSEWLSVEAGGMIGGLAVTALGIGLGRAARESGTQREETPPKARLRIPVTRAVIPFAILLGALLATRMVEPLASFLRELAVLSAPGTSVSVPLFYNPGFWMLATAALSIPFLGVSVDRLLPLAGPTLRRWLGASLAVAGFLCFSQIMLASGMTATLAEAVAESTGRVYVLLLPLVGGLGGFLTASTAGSNAMFAVFHSEIGLRLDLPADLVAAAQNAAGANTTLASPGRIVLAAAVAGLIGQEGALMRPALLLAGFGLLGTAAILGVWVGV